MNFTHLIVCMSLLLSDWISHGVIVRKSFGEIISKVIIKIMTMTCTVSIKTMTTEHMATVSIQILIEMIVGIVIIEVLVEVVGVV